MFLGKYLEKLEVDRRLRITLKAMKSVFKIPPECRRLLGEIIGDAEAQAL